MSTTLDHEPTLHDVVNMLVGMDGRLNSIDGRLDKVDDRFENMDKRFNTLESKFDTGFRFMHTRIDNIDERLVDLTHTVSKISVQLVRIEDTVDDHTEYIEDNSIKMAKHDSRIKKLEFKFSV